MPRSERVVGVVVGRAKHRSWPPRAVVRALAVCCREIARPPALPHPWGLSVEHGYTAGRRSSRATSLGATTLPTASYAYDVASGRMSSVSADGITATYRYNAATGWNEGVTYSGSSGLTSTQAMDNLGRLDAITWSVGSTTVSKHDYTLNAMNRRTKAERQDGSKWNYGYNSRGEVTNAAKQDNANIPEPGKQFTYAFDGLGNRTDSTVSSLGDDLTLRSTSYTANELNQYETIAHPQPGWLVLRGSANVEASVTIDGEPPDFTVGLRWFYEKSVVNSSGPVRRVAEITATRPTGGLNNGPVTTQRQGATFIPPPTEAPTYDLDGNQTSDARWNYAWNGENRLIVAEEKPIPTAVAAGVSTPSVTTRQKLEFTYDSQGRRLTKKVYEQRTENGTPGTFILKQSLVFLYDGWNMIAEIGSESSSASVPLAAPTLLRSYEWGLDVSDTMDGAGGVGGQLIQRHHLVSGIQHLASGAHAPLYDGNGNITELINLANGNVSARYEYGAFGETITVDGGAVADANPIRFSTKYLDVEAGLLYYGFRFNDTTNGRWLSRDPIEERGGVNLYGMVGNDAVNRWDYLGLVGGGGIGGPSWVTPYSTPPPRNSYSGTNYNRGNIQTLLRIVEKEGKEGAECNRCQLYEVRDLKKRTLKAALKWNQSSPPWANANQCSDQAWALAQYLSAHMPSLQATKGGDEVWWFGSDGGNVIPGGSFIPGFRHFGNHNVVKVVTGTLAEKCGFQDYYIDAFKGTSSLFQDENKDGGIGSGSWSSFKSHYPGFPASD